MTAFSGAFQNGKKRNALENKILRELCENSIFADNFSDAPKYSILRALGSRDFNI